MSLCPFCGARASANSTTIEFECGSDSTSRSSVSVNNNRCNLPPKVQIDAEELSPLERAYRHTNAMFAKSTESLMEIDLSHDLAFLYEDLIAEFNKFNSGTIITANQAFVVQACLAAKREFLNGTMALLRAQTNDSLTCVRKATEYALFSAWAVEKDASMIWFSANNSDEDWKKYRDTFKIMSIINLRKWTDLVHLSAELERLINDHELCSERVHATVMSAAPEIISMGIAGTQLILKDAYGSEEPLAVLEETLLFTLDCHLNVLDAIRKLFKHLDVEISCEWLQNFRTIEASVNEHFSKKNVGFPQEND